MADREPKAGAVELLWPVMQASADPKNLTVLDVDGNVLTSRDTLDPIYVNVGGDTMTGRLTVQATTAVAVDRALEVMGEDQAAQFWVTRASNAAAGPRVRLAKTRGTLAAPAGLAANDSLGSYMFFGALADGTLAQAGFIQVNCNRAPVAGDVTIPATMQLSVNSGGSVASGTGSIYITGDGRVGVHQPAPSQPLDVFGNAVIRGNFEVTDDITTTGNIDAGGVVTIKPPAGPSPPGGSLKVIGDNTNANLIVQRNSDANGNPSLRFVRTRGTTDAPTTIQPGDAIGAVAWDTIRTDGNRTGAGYIVVQCTKAPVAGDTNVASEMRLAVGTATGQAIPLKLTEDKVTTPCALEAYFGTFSGTVTTNSPFGTGFQSNATVTGVNEGLYSYYANLTRQSTTVKVTAGYVVDSTAKGTDFNAGFAVTALPAGANNYAFHSYSPANSYFGGNVGIKWFNPTEALEVEGNTVLRGGMEVTGNITSTGTAHSFAAGSIPGPAVLGDRANAPQAPNDPGTPGSIRFNENFLYIRTPTVWKKIPLNAL